MIDPHAKVSSAEQDSWVEIAEVLRNNVLRLAMAPNQNYENIIYALDLATKTRAFHITCLAFDDQLQAAKNSCHTYQEQEP